MGDNPLIDGVLFGDAVRECLNCYSRGEVALISRDSDYFQLGKSVRDSFVEKGIAVSTLVLDDFDKPDASGHSKLFSFRENVGLVVAVGNEEIINISRYFAGIFGKDIVVVPTKVTFMSVFAPKALVFENAKPKIMPCRKPKFVVIDLVFMSALKKQAYADAYCEVASKCVALADSLAVQALSGLKRSGTTEAVFKILQSVADNREEGAKCRVKIINAELRLGLLSGKDCSFLFGSEVYLGQVLGAVRALSVFENRFFINRPIIKLYEAFLMCDFTKSLVAPDYVGNIAELSATINCSEMEIIKEYRPYTFEEVCVAREKLVGANVLGFFKKLSVLENRLAETYKYVYKGRQKRAEFDVKEIKRAIRLSPYLCENGVLKIISDGGACDCLE